MAEEVEINPVVCAAPFAATEQAAIKLACGGEIVHGNGDVKWPERGHRSL
jgi:hypothetical protein